MTDIADETHTIRALCDAVDALVTARIKTASSEVLDHIDTAMVGICKAVGNCLVVGAMPRDGLDEADAAEEELYQAGMSVLARRTS